MSTFQNFCRMIKIAFFSLIMVSCKLESLPITTPQEDLTNSKIEYSYLHAPNDTNLIILSDSTTEFNGRDFFTIVSDDRDPYSRGVRIEIHSENSGTVSWLIEGDPINNPGFLSVETNSISSIDGDFMFLSSSLGEFSKIRIVRD